MTAPSSSSSSSHGGLLSALTHAVSGAAGAAIATGATYPLDLVTTRLKAQRQLVAEGRLAAAARYRGLVDAFRRIWADNAEGGRRVATVAAAFYVGLAQDLAKTVADQFLFFLFYNWFRAAARQRSSRRAGRTGQQRSRRPLTALEELAVGAAAGACARLLTTPMGNVVTRLQTSRLEAAGRRRESGKKKEGSGTEEKEEIGDHSVRRIVEEIRKEKGVLGLWSGYSASLVLTLNPSITFFLSQVFEQALVGPQEGPESSEVGAVAVFLLAATSKAIATAITYPFQIAKARVQVSHAPAAEKAPAQEEGPKASQPAADSFVQSVERGARKLAQDTIFATIVRIAQTEGIRALYDGIGGELLKAFFSHGTTMLSKDVVHRLLLRLYFVGLAVQRQSSEAEHRLVHASQTVTQQLWSRLLSNMSAAETKGRALLQRTVQVYKAA